MAGLPLEGRTALVTGASRGIGAATAGALDRAGARVALVARSEDGLASVASELEHDPAVIAADLVEPTSPAEIARQALAALGTVDILVNNAATAARLPTVQTDGAVIDEMLAVNVRAPLLLVAARSAGGRPQPTSPTSPTSSCSWLRTRLGSSPARRSAPTAGWPTRSTSTAGASEGSHEASAFGQFAELVRHAARA